MSIDEKWLQGRIAKPGDYDALPVEELLLSLLHSLGRERAEKTGSDRHETAIRSFLPPRERGA